MPANTQNQDPSIPKPEVTVTGAFEIFEKQREELDTLTRTGQLLKPGDPLPAIPGIAAEGKTFILHTVNAFGTETCDMCTDEVEAFHRDHPEIEVFSLTKQSPEQIREEDAKRTAEGKGEITHTRITIGEDTAIDLGVALAPGQGADEEFWPTALRRTLALVDPEGRIVAIQQPDDQEEKPDFTKIYEEAERLSS